MNQSTEGHAVIPTAGEVPDLNMLKKKEQSSACVVDKDDFTRVQDGCIATLLTMIKSNQTH